MADEAKVSVGDEEVVEVLPTMKPKSKVTRTGVCTICKGGRVMKVAADQLEAHLKSGWEEVKR